MAGIELTELTKHYADGTRAVKSIDLGIEDGEFMILVGPSGCGKTTALRMIAGLESITSGTVRIGDRVVNDVPPKSRDIAMVFQNYALYPHMTVRENIGFALRMAGVKPGDRASRVQTVAETLGLEAHLERKPANLSGGQRQRVAIGRAMVRQPQAFLMDEPLSNLDAKLRVQMRVELSRLQARLGTTTVYVTHDQTEAMTLGDRIAVLRGGAIEQIGTPEQIYDHPANLFVGGFIGSPAMNFVSGRLVDGDLKTPFGDTPIDRRLAGHVSPRVSRDVIVGIRPESFEDAALTADGAGRSVRFGTRIDLVEKTGAETLAYFEVPVTAGLPTGPPDMGDDETSATGAEGVARAVARLDAASRVRSGADAELAVRADGLLVFDRHSGETLMRRPG